MQRILARKFKELGERSKNSKKLQTFYVHRLEAHAFLIEQLFVYDQQIQCNFK